MRITVFTSNQPRHIALIETLARVADTVYAVQECVTTFPGQVDDFFRKSDVMRDYFGRVQAAEQAEFGDVRFLSSRVRSLSLKMGDLSRVALRDLQSALASDVFVVFGASYIRGPLCDALVARNAINIHMGVSPFYRGSSTNFWALYDNKPEYVGATIHLLTKGLDSGPILWHAFPPTEACDAFALGMRAVRAAHASVAQRIADRAMAAFEPVAQDRALEMRYTRNADFNDEVASEYLGRLMAPDKIATRLAARPVVGLVSPWSPNCACVCPGGCKGSRPRSPDLLEFTREA
ncbi:MAG: hypothetical protein KDA32_05810 [Phycisphaerales bacterium]|nr:hypothetical protein [Phycisphaerales bacterium]